MSKQKKRIWLLVFLAVFLLIVIAGLIVYPVNKRTPPQKVIVTPRFTNVAVIPKGGLDVCGTLFLTRGGAVIYSHDDYTLQVIFNLRQNYSVYEWNKKSAWPHPSITIEEVSPLKEEGEVKFKVTPQISENITRMVLDTLAIILGVFWVLLILDIISRIRKAKRKT